jgi:hypothetical protein
VNGCSNHNKIRICLCGKPYDLFVRSSFGDVGQRARTISSREVRHAFLDVTSQASERGQPTFRKHRRYLVEVVSDYINSMKLGSHVI